MEFGGDDNNNCDWSRVTCQSSLVMESGRVGINLGVTGMTHWVKGSQRCY